MLGTQKTVQAKNLFKHLPFSSNSNLDTDFFSSDSSIHSDNNSDLEMTDSSTSTLISDLTNPFAGGVDLKDKVGLSLFAKATEGLGKDTKFNLSQDTVRKTVKAIEQANQAYF